MKTGSSALPLRRQADPPPSVVGDSLRLSASALESYRDCPRKYYYAYMLGLPQEGNIYTAFGSALHDALEAFNRARMVGPMLPWPEVEQTWERLMQAAPFESEGQFRQLRCGR